MKTKLWVVVALAAVVLGLRPNAWTQERPGGNGGGPTNGITQSTADGRYVKQTGGITTSVNGSGITNATGIGTEKILLYTNKTASYKGLTYSFPSSTTAGLAELQQTFPAQYSPLNPSGLTIELADNSPYYITAPLNLTNVAHIKGQGKNTSGFIYVGPTNLYTLSQVTNRANQVGVLGFYDPSVNTCGIINFFGNQTQHGGGGDATNIVAGDGLFEDFFIMTATNFPCFLLDCSESVRLDVERVAFLGSEGFQLRQNYNMLWDNPAPTNASSVVGCICTPANKCTFKNNLFSQLADGVIFGGNTMLLSEDNAFSGMGMVGLFPSVIHTNAYPLTSILSIGFGTFSEANTFHSTIIHDVNYNCYVPHVVGGAALIIDDTPQNVGGVFIATLGTSVSGPSGIVTYQSGGTGSILSLPWFGAIKKVGGNYLLTTSSADFLTEATVGEATVSGDGVYYYDCNTLSYHMDSVVDAGAGVTFAVPVTISSQSLTVSSGGVSSTNLVLSGTTNQITWGTTNQVPASTNPVLWVPVLFNGTRYTMPLMPRP